MTPALTKDQLKALRKQKKGAPVYFVGATMREKYIVMSEDDFEGWKETFAILSDPQLVADLREAIQETETISLEEVKKKYNGKDKSTRKKRTAKGQR